MEGILLGPMTLLLLTAVMSTLYEMRLQGYVALLRQQSLGPGPEHRRGYGYRKKLKSLAVGSRVVVGLAGTASAGADISAMPGAVSTVRAQDPPPTPHIADSAVSLTSMLSEDGENVHVESADVRHNDCTTQGS